METPSTTRAIITCPTYQGVTDRGTTHKACSRSWTKGAYSLKDLNGVGLNHQMDHWRHGYSYMIHHDSGSNHSTIFSSPVFRSPSNVAEELPLINAHEIKSPWHPKQLSKSVAVKLWYIPLNAPTIVSLQAFPYWPIPLILNTTDHNHFPALVERLLRIPHQSGSLTRKHWPHYR